jgi:hypothetical protein
MAQLDLLPLVTALHLLYPIVTLRSSNHHFHNTSCPGLTAGAFLCATGPIPTSYV